MLGGETEEKTSYTWENYKYYNPSTESSFNIGNDIIGTKYDVAHVKWGDGARMPTLAEAEELANYCTFKRGSYNGVKGHYVIGPNGKNIFFPSAGGQYDGILEDEGIKSYFWTSKYYGKMEGVGGLAYYLCGFENYGFCAEAYICAGISVRPVTGK